LRGTGDRQHCLQVLDAWADILIAGGDHRRAAELWGCVEGHMAPSRLASGRGASVRQELEAALPAQDLEEALGTGRISRPEQLVDKLAVEECGS